MYIGQFFDMRYSHYSKDTPAKKITQILVRKSKMVTLRGVNLRFGRWTVNDTFIALQNNFQVGIKN